MKKLVNVVKLVAFGLSVSLAGGTGHASPYSSAVQALNPVYYWQFQEAAGVAGSPITAGTTSANTGSAGVSLATSGQYSNGTSTAGDGVPLANFPGMTGDNASVNFGAPNAIVGVDWGLPLDLSDMSWTGWVKFTAGDASNHDLFSYGGSANGGTLFTLVSPSAIDTNLNGTGTLPGVIGNFGVSQHGDGVGTSFSINDGAWHFLAYTLDNDGAGTASYNLFVDGVLGANKSMITNIHSNGVYYIGNDPYGFAFLGQTAQQAVFASVLSQSQVSSLYAAAVPEPSSITLLGLGALGLHMWIRRRKAV